RFFTDDVMLRGGNNLSLFCGTRKLWEDSIATVDFAAYSSILKASYEKDKKNFAFLGGRYPTYIYKDKQRNESSEYDYFGLTHWKCTEPMQKPTWTITDSTRNCMGLDCIMATTQFKGRKWTAWFAPEIPVSDGPWKLWGLPGLILDAYDENHDYEFTAQKIITSSIADVGYMFYTPQSEYNDVSREKFLKEWRKSLTMDRVSAMKAELGINLPSSKTRRAPAYEREERTNGSD
ncbi:MAG: GLPGLI family protein, partial [Muribaculaceae bacterium]|nr:GLPGLI family protein [Muribaculaceae bacterium]